MRSDEWGLTRALASGEVTLSRELDIEAFDGQRKTILDSDAPLRDEMGAIVGGMSVLVDITERKRLERRTHDVLDALLAMAEALMLDPGAADVHDGEERMATREVDVDAPFVSHAGVHRVMELTQRVFGASIPL